MLVVVVDQLKLAIINVLLSSQHYCAFVAGYGCGLAYAVGVCVSVYSVGILCLAVKMKSVTEWAGHGSTEI